MSSPIGLRRTVATTDTSGHLATPGGPAVPVFEPELVDCEFVIPSKDERKSPKASPKTAPKSVKLSADMVRTCIACARRCLGGHRCACRLPTLDPQSLQPQATRKEIPPSKKAQIDQLASELDAVAILSSEKAPGIHPNPIPDALTSLF